MSERRRRGRSPARDREDLAEPFPSPWVECGGELYFAVDLTSAGFPIGLRWEELDAALGGSASDPCPPPPGAFQDGRSRDPF